jgi:hypothetical protein
MGQVSIFDGGWSADNREVRTDENFLTFFGDQLTRHFERINVQCLHPLEEDDTGGVAVVG